MVSSKATSVTQYLAELPPDRRKVVAAVRKMVNASIAKGFKETMSWGMIAWEVPLTRYPDTYNGQPLSFAALAAQKGYFALYLTCAYSDPVRGAAIRKAFKDAGKKLDMGKSCVRFKRLEDIVMPALADAIRGVSVEEFIRIHEASRAKR